MNPLIEKSAPRSVARYSIGFPDSIKIDFFGHGAFCDSRQIESARKSAGLPTASVAFVFTRLDS